MSIELEIYVPTQSCVIASSLWDDEAVHCENDDAWRLVAMTYKKTRYQAGFSGENQKRGDQEGMRTPISCGIPSRSFSTNATPCQSTKVSWFLVRSLIWETAPGSVAS